MLVKEESIITTGASLSARGSHFALDGRLASNRIFSKVTFRIFIIRQFQLRQVISKYHISKAAC